MKQVISQVIEMEVYKKVYTLFYQNGQNPGTFCTLDP